MNAAIRNIQLVAVVIVLVSTILAFLIEIIKMYETQNVTLADLLLMFIYIEVIGSNDKTTVPQCIPTTLELFKSFAISNASSGLV